MGDADGFLFVTLDVVDTVDYAGISDDYIRLKLVDLDVFCFALLYLYRVCTALLFAAVVIDTLPWPVPRRAVGLCKAPVTPH